MSEEILKQCLEMAAESAMGGIYLAIPTECHPPQQTQVQGFSKNYFSRFILFLSIFSIPIAIPIPICRSLVIGVGIGIAIGIDFLFLNTVQSELLEFTHHS